MKKFAIEIKYATLHTLGMVVWSILERELGYHDEKIANYLFFGMLSGFILLAVLLFGMLEKKRSYFKNDMTFKQGFVSGVVIAFLSALFSPLWQYITLYIISPELSGKLIERAVSNGAMALEQAQLFYGFRSYVLQSAYTTLSFGMILSALLALILKTKKTN